MELGGVRSIKGLDLVPRTPLFGGYVQTPPRPLFGVLFGRLRRKFRALLPMRASPPACNIFAAFANVSVLIEAATATFCG